MKRYRPAPKPVAEIALADVAPRLARARDDLLVWRRAVSHRRVELLKALSNLERLVAHRDLQRVRAALTRDRKYMAQRDRKLAHAQERADRVRGLLKQLDEEV